MKRILFLGLTLMGAPAAAHAACTVSTGGITFGVYNPTVPTPSDSAGSISVECTDHEGDNGYVIALDSGGSDGSQRHMTGSGGALGYRLYLDAGHSQAWGNGIGGSSVIAGAGSARQTYPIYGRIAARQPVVPGAYFDLLVTTVTF